MRCGIGNRRAFLSDVGRGMLAAGLGTALANDLGFSTAFAEQGADSIPLGKYASLVELMRNTPAEKLQPLLATKLMKGETVVFVHTGGLPALFAYAQDLALPNVKLATRIVP